ncbi:tail assembly chaperone [Mycobacterium phage BigPaolini]|nr:tail assembly chaperone [Mycobacterium phage BigPaolini]
MSNGEPPAHLGGPWAAPHLPLYLARHQNRKACQTMSKILTLDTIREEADREYGAPVQVQISKDTTVSLKNVMRLRKDVRKDILTQLEAIRTINDKADGDKTEADAEKLTDAVFKILELAAGRDSETLMDAVDEDVALATKILNHWLEETQAGEASSSED